MVAFSMFVIGLWISVLALLNSNHRATVLAVGVSMIALAAIVHAGIRRKSREEQLPDIDPLP